jgi:acyl dehydratase
LHRSFESVRAGDRVESLYGPLGPAHLMRWSAAMENWHRIHYDQPFSVGHEQLPGLLINGSFKQQFIVSLLRHWAGHTGWLWKVDFQFRAMNVAGETLTAWMEVESTRRHAQFGCVGLKLGIRNEKGLESTPGHATVALPYADGAPLPYPFKPPAD